MSDDSVIVVHLGSLACADLMADALTAWLTSTGVLRTNPDPVYPFDHGFLAGPRHRSVINDPRNLFTPAGRWGGADVHRSPEVFFSGSNYQPPHCDGCGVRLESQTYLEYVDKWVDAGEPRVGCGACGWAGLLGDWPGTWAFAVGAPALEFYNWPELTAEFLAEVNNRLGPRTRVVYQHM